MDNINNPIPTNNATNSPPAVTPQPVGVGQAGIQKENNSKPKNSFSNILVLIKQKTRDLINNIPEKYRKILGMVIKLFVATVLILLIVFVVYSIFFKKESDNRNIVATPSPEASATPLTTLDSTRYSTDSAVLKLEEDLANISKELNSLNITDVDLIPPNFDFDISFD